MAAEIVDGILLLFVFLILIALIGKFGGADIGHIIGAIVKGIPKEISSLEGVISLIVVAIVAALGFAFVVKDFAYNLIALAFSLEKPSEYLSGKLVFVITAVSALANLLLLGVIEIMRNR